MVKKKTGLGGSKQVVGQTRRDDLAAELRKDEVLIQLRKTSRKTHAFSVDFDETQAELIEINRTASKTYRNKTLNLGSSTSLSEVADARMSIQAARDRAVEIINEMRTVYTLANEVYGAGSSYLRQQPILKGFNVDATTAIVDNALREFTRLCASAELIIEQGIEVIKNLDAKTRSLDTWLGVFREYVFINGSKTGSLDGARDRHASKKLRAV